MTFLYIFAFQGIKKNDGTLSLFSFIFFLAEMHMVILVKLDFEYDMNSVKSSEKVFLEQCKLFRTSIS